MTTIHLIPPGLPKSFTRLRLLAALIVLVAAISMINGFSLFDSNLVNRFSEQHRKFSILMLLTGLLLILQPFKTRIGQLVPYYIGGMLVSIPAFSPGDPTSFYFLVCGVAILLMETHQGLLHYAAQVLLIFAATIAYLVAITFLYDLSGPRTSNSIVFMSPSTSIALVSLSLNILLQNPDKGIMKHLTGSLAGSVTFRILWPVAVLVPTILGIVRLLGHRYGFYTNESGVALFAVGTILVFLGFLYYSSLDLNRRDELRIKMEQSLKLSEDEMQAIFANAPDAVIVMDSSGRVAKWNPAAEKIFGWTAGEVTGTFLNESIIPPDYRAAHLAGLERYVKTGESRISFRTIEMPALRKDGELTEVSMRITPYTLHGRPYFLGFLRDVSEIKKTERKRLFAEQKFTGLFESAPDATFITNQNGLVLSANQQSTELFGLSARQLTGRKIGSLIEADFAKLYNERRSSAEYDGRDFRIVFESKAIAPGNITIPVEISLSAFYSDEGVLFSSAIRDITHRKENLLRLTDELRTLTGHLQNIREEERIHIAREIHDELGQLMTVMKMDIGWLKKHLQYEESDKIGRKLEDIHSTVDITIKTIRKIASELRPSLLDDIGLVAAIEWHLTEFCNRTGITTDMILDAPGPDLPDQVKTSLFRIVQEALTNVARHSQATKVDVSLKLDNGKLVLTVCDNGTGFDVYKESRTLGILGMKERALMIGAEYSVESKKGMGTVVTISYPVDIQRD